MSCIIRRAQSDLSNFEIVEISGQNIVSKLLLRSYVAWFDVCMLLGFGNCFGTVSVMTPTGDPWAQLLLGPTYFIIAISRTSSKQ